MLTSSLRYDQGGSRIKRVKSINGMTKRVEEDPTWDEKKRLCYPLKDLIVVREEERVGNDVTVTAVATRKLCGA